MEVLAEGIEGGDDIMGQRMRALAGSALKGILVAALASLHHLDRAGQDLGAQVVAALALEVGDGVEVGDAARQAPLGLRAGGAVAGAGVAGGRRRTGSRTPSPMASAAQWPRSECTSPLPSLPREGRSASPRPAGRATPQTRSEHGRAASIIGSGRSLPERCMDMPFGRKHFPSMENFNSVGYTLHPNDATFKRKVTPERQRASGVIMSVGTEVGGYTQGVSGSIKASHNVPAAIPLRTTRKVQSGGGSQVLSLGVAAALGA
mmetsp:Transcript_72208/g.194573  ORF Transcript_72208/g.194573 Transcript_72208/m.194573 type:complete len:262 (+) Transcript_72208:949-1734(+)